MSAALVLGVAGTLWISDRDPGHTATSIITAAAAVAVAMLTVLTTDRRQDKQLAHDSERQAAEIKHQRLLKGREELIELLEGAAVALGAGRRAQETVSGLWRREVDPDSPEAREGLALHTRSVEQVREARAKLLLRYDAEEAVAHAYREANLKLDDYRRTLRGYATRESYPEARVSIAELRRQLINAEVAFLAVARAELDARRLDAD
jgi:hypothetical protein